MRNFFDYIYYKVAKTYHKWDRKKGITGIFAVTLMQTILTAHLVFIPIRLVYPVSILSNYSNEIKFILVGIGVIFFIVNYRLYNNQYHKIKKRYENESHSFVKGFLVILALLAPLISILIFAVHLKPL